MITAYQRFRLDNEYDVLKSAGLSDANIVSALKALADRLGLSKHAFEDYLTDKGLP